MGPIGFGEGGDAFALLVVAVFTVFAAIHIRYLWQSRDALPEWEAPYNRTWPLHLRRDAYRWWCVFWIALSPVLALAYIVVFR